MRMGIIGGGQLGRMLAHAAQRLGIDVTILDPKENCSAGQVARQIVGAYDDIEKLCELAAVSDAITYEFENVPIEPLAALDGKIPLNPSPQGLAAAQDRLTEKTLFRSVGMQTTDFAAIDSLPDLQREFATMNGACILKTRRFGYDGKGQARIDTQEDVQTAWDDLKDSGPLILEKRIDFKRELAIIAARDAEGNEALYPMTQTHHRHGILHRTIAPAPMLSAEIESQARSYVDKLLKQLDYVGVLALELFETNDGLLANEFAPRVHNSGHWTIEGTTCSQFENQVRAVMGLPLGEPTLRGPTGMLNLIGDIPSWAPILAQPNTALHLYGKAGRAGRKVGHITVTDSSDSDVLKRIDAIEKTI